MIVVVPSTTPDVQAEAWQAVGELYRRLPGGWVVVGGQMVQFHCWRAGVAPPRATLDIDLGLATRPEPSIFPRLTGELEAMGFRPVLHDSEIEYRWVRPSQAAPALPVQFDVLLPSNLGQHAPRSVNGRRGLESRGIEWVTRTRQTHEVCVGGSTFTVPVPHLLGAMVAKSSALLNTADRYKGRHLEDLALLCDLATVADLRRPLTAKERDRLGRALARCEQTTAVRRALLAVRD
ncbi:hypothetical protein G7070_14680 [Propioniciclava coleopterorum]|uniref:Nucleotidyl transferase AbiEii toxin, Type IV TA system n=1 Tax=Propioniciclava coleopterorum TaxID=2714937 RepID=A0A6G7Y9C1_9ACTN|nr:hypothetical protein [Propioniciclava coleopterorum]QIK73276.1 hypothetical protein G7070_14680 [Propioniciclava coleopterorum]